MGGTQGAPKKKSFIVRDVYKLCKSISRLWPRDKHGKLSSCSSFDPKTKLKTQSKQTHRPDVSALEDLISRDFQEGKGEAKEDGVRLCRVHSYRYGGTDLVNNKNPLLSRCYSQSKATGRDNLSPLARSKSSCHKRDAGSGYAPSFRRSASTTGHRSFTNPILYSTSTANVAKPPPTEEILTCTLEELCNGCTKKIMIKRDVITSIGEISEEEEMVEIKVKPGWKGGTKVTFEGKGNQTVESVPADLTFVIAEKEHDMFTRDGDDLQMEIEIPLFEALMGCDLSVALPDGDNMKLRVDDVIHHGYITLIEGKGMPIVKEQGRRGDLRIRFLTKFPETLTKYQRAEIQRILESST